MTSSYRLPLHVQPVHYDLWLDVNLHHGSVHGVALLHVSASSATEQLVLHAGPRFAFHSIEWQGLDDGPLRPCARVEYPAAGVPAEERLLRLWLPRGAVPLRVRFEWDAPLDQEPMAGLYTSWVTVTPRRRATLASQMQPVAARTVFPCFDEPLFRSTFTLHARVTEEEQPPHTPPLVLLSNMPASGPTSASGWVTFGTTPPMATYLLALVAAPLTLVATSGVVRVWALPGQATDAAAAAASTAAAVLADLGHMLRQPYPLPKLDLVPVADFDAGGMENWGCILFGADALLGDTATKEDGDDDMRSLVAHEVAHQWFGNLVTTPAWEQLWLNEGLTTFAAAWSLARIAGDRRGAQRVWADFAATELPSALGSAGLPGALPIAGTRLRTAADAVQMFDSRAYAKAALVMRMVWAHIGSRAMARALRRYVRVCAFGAASEAVLLAAFEAEGSGTPLGAAVRHWLHRPGVPCVRIDAQHLRVTQEPFALLPAQGSDTQPWPLLLPGRTWFRDRSNKVRSTVEVALAAASCLPAVVLCQSLTRAANPAATVAQLVSVRLVTAAGAACVSDRLRSEVSVLAHDADGTVAAVASSVLATWAALAAAARSNCSTFACDNNNKCKCGGPRPAGSGPVPTDGPSPATVTDIMQMLRHANDDDQRAAADAWLRDNWHVLVAQMGPLGASELCAAVSAVIRPVPAQACWEAFFTQLAAAPQAAAYRLAAHEAAGRCAVMAQGVREQRKCWR